MVKYNGEVLAESNDEDTVLSDVSLTNNAFIKCVHDNNISTVSDVGLIFIDGTFNIKALELVPNKLIGTNSAGILELKEVIK